MLVLWGKRGVMRKKQEDLTEKETEVIFYLASGLSNKEIAQKMYVTEHTVKAHLTSIFKKFNVTNRTAAALIAKDRLNPHQDSTQP